MMGTVTATKPRSRNRAAVERTLTALRSGGRLKEVDSAVTALGRHLADALDDLDPVEFPHQTAALARVHLAAVQILRGRDEVPDRDSDIGDLLAALSAPPSDER
jgi:hypothetical protein